MASDGIVIFVILAAAAMLSVPGSLAFLRSQRAGMGDGSALEKRVHDLEAQVVTLSAELAAVRTDRDRLLSDVREERIRSAQLNAEIQRLQTRLSELEHLTEAYRMLQQQVLQLPSGPSLGLPARQREVHPPSSSRSSVATLEKQLNEARRQVAIVEVQITAAGGDEKAEPVKIRDRDKLLETIRSLEADLDAHYQAGK